MQLYTFLVLARHGDALFELGGTLGRAKLYDSPAIGPANPGLAVAKLPV